MTENSREVASTTPLLGLSKLLEDLDADARARMDEEAQQIDEDLVWDAIQKTTPRQADKS